jgi:hypothetical protein
MTLRNNLVEQTCYTNRLQIDKFRVGASAITGCVAQAGDLLHLAYGYTDGIQTGNNGNIVSQTITMPKAANMNTSLVVNQSSEKLTHARKISLPTPAGDPIFCGQKAKMFLGRDRRDRRVRRKGEKAGV